MTPLTLRALRVAVLLLLLCTVAFGGRAAGQDSLRYAGPYRLGEIDGRATFDYRAQRGDTLRQGPFTFLSQTEPPVTDQKENDVRNVRGQFDVMGQPVGDWAFTLGSFTASGPGIIVDFEYRQPLTGRQQTVTGRFAEGRATGQWDLAQLPVERGMVGDTLLRSRYAFAGGIPQLTFRLARGEDELLGRLNRQGVADDEWVFYRDFALSETWRFRTGLLTAVLQIDEYGDSLLLPVFDAVEATELMDLGPTYFQLLATWQDLLDRPTNLAEDGAATLLTANATAYAEVRDMLTQLASREVLQLPQVRVPSYPHPRAAARELEETGLLLTQIDSLARQLRSASNLAVLGSADVEAAYALAALERVTGPFLAPVRRVVRAHEAGLLRHLPRSRYYASLWPTPGVDGVFELSVPVGGGAQVRGFEGPEARVFRPTEGSGEIRALTAYALRSIESLRVLLRERLNTRERRQIVSAYEDQLAVEYARLDSLIGAQPRRVARDYRLRTLRERAQQLIQEYNTVEDSGIDDEVRIQEATACLQDLEALAVALIELPARAAEVRAAYTDQVWNNNTATLMNERAKRHLIDAYEEVLLPYFRTAAAGPPPLTCARARRLEAEIRTATTRLLALRTADTDQLEDDLRDLDEDAPDAATRVLKLLDVATPQ